MHSRPHLPDIQSEEKVCENNYTFFSPSPNKKGPGNSDSVSSVSNHNEFSSLIRATAQLEVDEKEKTVSCCSIF